MNAMIAMETAVFIDKAKAKMKREVRPSQELMLCDMRVMAEGSPDNTIYVDLELWRFLHAQ